MDEVKAKLAVGREAEVGWLVVGSSGGPDSTRALKGVVVVLESILADALPPAEDLAFPQHHELDADRGGGGGEEVVAGAAYTLAVLLEEGRGAPKDRERSAFLYSFAARAGLLSAQYNLGMMLLTDPPPNTNRLLPRGELLAGPRLVPTGASQRGPASEGLTAAGGLWWLRGWWPKEEKGAGWTDKVKASAYGACQVPTYQERVNRWAGALLLEAAKQGHVVAMHNLGVLLANGEAPGLLKDDEMAEVLFQTASDKAHAPSTKKLAVIRRERTVWSIFTFGAVILVGVFLAQLLITFGPWGSLLEDMEGAGTSNPNPKGTELDGSRRD